MHEHPTEAGKGIKFVVGRSDPDMGVPEKYFTYERDE